MQVLVGSFNALTGLNCYYMCRYEKPERILFQCPHGLELLQIASDNTPNPCVSFQCPHGLELLLVLRSERFFCHNCFNALTGLNCYEAIRIEKRTDAEFQCPHGLELLQRKVFHLELIWKCFNALTGLNCYGVKNPALINNVSMPSRA